MSLKEFVKQVAADLHPSFQAGLNDAHQALKAFPDSMQPASVLGQAGMPTPGEVDRAMNPPETYEQHMQQTVAAMEARQVDAPAQDREMTR